MAITNFSWLRDNTGTDHKIIRPAGLDVHVLRNNHPSAPLDTQCFITDNDSGAFRTNLLSVINSNAALKPNDFEKVEFHPNFAGGVFNLNGITVNKNTGEVRASAVPFIDPGAISNFILSVKLFKTLAAGGGVYSTILQIRIHVHPDIDSIWLTPDPLTVRPLANSGIHSFTLRYDGPGSPHVKIFADPALSDAIWDIPSWPSGTNQVFPEIDYLGDMVYAGPVFVSIIDQAGIPGLGELIPVGVDDHVAVGDTVGDFTVTSVEIIGAAFLTVYAKFTDDTVGNITFNHGITWTTSNPNIALDSIGRIIASQGAVQNMANPDVLINIIATLPERLSRVGLTSGTGHIRVYPSFSSMDFPATRLSGPGVDLNGRADNFMNFLIVGDGIPSSRDGNFSTLMAALAKDMSNAIFEPWDQILTHYANIWFLRLPSLVDGISELYETVIFPDGPTGADVYRSLPDFISFIDNHSTSPLASNEISLADLVKKVGLPVGNDSMALLATKINEWQTFFDSNLVGVSGLSTQLVVNQEIFDYWTYISNRRFLNQRDSVMHLANGALTSFADDENVNYFHYSRGVLNQILKKITNVQGGASIGEYWSRSPDGTYGKDYEKVIIFTAGGPAGPVNYYRIIGNKKVHYGLFVQDHSFGGYPAITNATTFHSEINSQPFDLIPSQSLTSLIVHELSHSYNIGDEYAWRENGTSPPPPNLLAIELPAHNLVKKEDVTTSLALDASKAIWKKWPRIKKCGVVQGTITEINTAQGIRYLIPLHSGQGAIFALNEILRLRKRDLLNPGPTFISPKVQVTLIQGDNIQVKIVQGGTTLVPSDYPEGSLLFLPVAPHPGANNNPQGMDYAEVMAQIIQTKINLTNTPNTVVPCVMDLDPVQTPINLPTGLLSPKGGQLPAIIGLYSGGMYHSCGVYHPAGNCLMRKQSDWNNLCQVCKYAIADQVSPLLHSFIEASYAPNYPKV